MTTTVGSRLPKSSSVTMAGLVFQRALRPTSHPTRSGHPISSGPFGTQRGGFSTSDAVPAAWRCTCRLAVTESLPSTRRPSPSGRPGSVAYAMRAFSPSPRSAAWLGEFDTVVMFGNNFGLFGNPRRARWLLQRLRNLTSPAARIVAESRNPLPRHQRRPPALPRAEPSTGPAPRSAPNSRALRACPNAVVRVPAGLAARNAADRRWNRLARREAGPVARLAVHRDPGEGRPLESDSCRSWLSSHSLFGPLFVGLIFQASASEFGWLRSVAVPIDRGALLRGRPLFGANKTYRGMLAVALGAAAGYTLQSAAPELHTPALRVLPTLGVAWFGFAPPWCRDAQRAPQQPSQAPARHLAGRTGSGRDNRAIFYLLDQIDFLLGARLVAWPWVPPTLPRVLWSVLFVVVVHQFISSLGALWHGCGLQAEEEAVLLQRRSRLLRDPARAPRRCALRSGQARRVARLAAVEGDRVAVVPRDQVHVYSGSTVWPGRAVQLPRTPMPSGPSARFSASASRRESCATALSEASSASSRLSKCALRHDQQVAVADGLDVHEAKHAVVLVRRGDRELRRRTILQKMQSSVAHRCSLRWPHRGVGQAAELTHSRSSAARPRSRPKRHYTKWSQLSYLRSRPCDGVEEGGLDRLGDRAARAGADLRGRRPRAPASPRRRCRSGTPRRPVELVARERLLEHLDALVARDLDHRVARDALEHRRERRRLEHAARTMNMFSPLASATRPVGRA